MKTNSVLGILLFDEVDDDEEEEVSFDARFKKMPMRENNIAEMSRRKSAIDSDGGRDESNGVFFVMFVFCECVFYFL